MRASELLVFSKGLFSSCFFVFEFYSTNVLILLEMGKVRDIVEKFKDLAVVATVSHFCGEDC